MPSIPAFRSLVPATFALLAACGGATLDESDASDVPTEDAGAAYDAGAAVDAGPRDAAHAESGLADADVPDVTLDAEAGATGHAKVVASSSGIGFPPTPVGTTMGGAAAGGSSLT